MHMYVCVACGMPAITLALLLTVFDRFVQQTFGAYSVIILMKFSLDSFLFFWFYNLFCMLLLFYNLLHSPYTYARRK